MGQGPSQALHTVGRAEEVREARGGLRAARWGLWDHQARPFEAHRGTRHIESQRPPQEPTEAKDHELRLWSSGVHSVLPGLTKEGITFLAPAVQRQPGGALWKGTEGKPGLQRRLGKDAILDPGPVHSLQPCIETPHLGTKFLTKCCAHLPGFSQHSSHLGERMVSPCAGKIGQY